MTGGTTGIGRATAQLFHAAGARVIVTGQNPSTLERARAELPSGVTVLRSDARSVADAERLAKDVARLYDGVDVLFLNAGIAKLAPFETVDEAFYEEHMSVNVKGVVFTLQKLLPLFRTGASVIVNTSVAGQRGAPNMAIYAASKGAAAALVRSLAIELVPRRIRVNAISPAAIRTPIQGKFGLPPDVQAAAEEAFTKRIPFGRFGEVDEVARLALFLASDASSFVTGAEIPIDGGLMVA
ncbi:MAG TPA: SDR family oxidoreductase [Polyangiaceae bacterium]|nr:SDR family oxidoreductase [Polyangiaceae bacterium]